jgi:hypothetical protein
MGLRGAGKQAQDLKTLHPWVIGPSSPRFLVIPASQSSTSRSNLLRTCTRAVYPLIANPTKINAFFLKKILKSAWRFLTADEV